MSAPEFRLTPLLPGPYRQLLWRTFFEERGRGFSLEDHFPQTSRPRDGVSYAVLEAGDEVLAGLMVRALPAPPGEVSHRAAAIGLVCVARAHRGKGLSRKLLSRCIEALTAQGIEAMTLWTTKPAVYQPLDFETADTTVAGWVGIQRDPLDAQQSLLIERWPDALERRERGRGLPPFAFAAQRITSADARASAVLLWDPLGASVAEWIGPPDAVTDMLARLMPPRWRLHAVEGDALPDVLASRGSTVALAPNALQMWRAPGTAQAWSRQYRLRLLDRI
jgi:GNAT superfamily N-acetyltransferase